MARIALFTNESLIDIATGTFKVGLVQERQPGYWVHNDGWKSLDQAAQYVEERNAVSGITKEDALEILASSIGASQMASDGLVPR